MKYKPGNYKTFLKLILLVLIIFATEISCATQNKHRKIKAVPCPCETQNKR